MQKKGPGVQVLILGLGVLTFLFSPLTFSQEKKVFPKTELLEDTRQLANILESAHPDPYINGGGKIAFHRKLQETLAAIPESGITADEFYSHLLPFVASIGDGHTTLTNPTPVEDTFPGLPLGFKAVDKNLYVSEVYREEDRGFFGARLTSVQGVSLAELLKRQRNLKGYDNLYQNLTNLIDALKTLEGLRSLIPHQKNDKVISVGLKIDNCEALSLDLPLTETLPEKIYVPETHIQLPSTQRQDFAYGFLDEDKQIAILLIDGMMGYREAYELFYKMGLPWVQRGATRIYRKFHETEPPKEVEEIVAGLPSATETFTSLFKDIKEAGSKTLIVDVRKNTGGNSAMTQILLYFLYGRATVLKSMNLGYSIKKYSELYFKNYGNVTLEEINRNQEVTLTGNDYDFKTEKNFFSVDKDKGKDKAFMEFLGQMPTFMDEYRKGTYEAYYLPENIIVLTSARTYSSGFTLLTLLYKSGATIVGVPSAQAGNCFGDTIGFSLSHTGIKGLLSHKRSVMFPNDPEKGRILSPHYELNYEKSASYNFDPNATVLLALETLPHLHHRKH